MPLPTHNPALLFVKQNWFGNPLNLDENQYQNLDGKSERGFKDVLKWQLGPKPLKKLKKNQKSSLEVVTDGAFLAEPKDGFTWLGHTSYVFDLSGVRLVVDPILYSVSIVKRFTDLPCLPEQLLNIDYLLLSHNHRDHIDEKSVKLLCKLNPKAVILTGLQTSVQLKKWNIKNTIIEAGWFQEYNLPQNQLKISYLPAKHWTRRYMTDTNISLWGSFMIQDQILDKTIYFGADSGYGVHFKQIAEIFPTIDYALLGIGAYEPQWFMHTSHTGPADALLAFNDLAAKTFIPMHYGTFDLSDEPIFYPEQVLKELLVTQPQHSVFFNSIGRKLRL